MDTVQIGFYVLIGGLIGALIVALALRRHVAKEAARAWELAREDYREDGRAEPFTIPDGPTGWHCAVCGCTDDHACEGGCYWVYPGLCSACAEKIVTGTYGYKGFLDVGPHDAVILHLPMDVKNIDLDSWLQGFVDGLRDPQKRVIALEGGIKAVGVVRRAEATGNE